MYLVSKTILQKAGNERNMTYEEFKEKVGGVILTDGGNCPVMPVVQMLQGKWKLQILYELCIKSPMRFGELKKMLEEKGISVKEGIYEKNALHLKGISNVAEMQEFKDGLFHVQDESSMLAVDVLDPAANEKILDVCAAPGGKSFYAAERMGGGGRVVSCDIYPHKTELISVTADRLGLGIIETRLRDASVLNEDDREKYDRVIIDAPCSGLGIIRKKPDIKINRTGEDIDSLIELQKRIIDASAECVKPGGLLVYSTCTICKKENEMNFKYILERGDFEPEDISKNLPEALKEFSGSGCVQLLPGINGTDGFFIAAARKKAL